MLKHYSPITHRIERCRAIQGACKYITAGENVSDLQLLERVAEDAAEKRDTSTYLAVKQQLEDITTASTVLDSTLPTYEMDGEQEHYDELRSRYDAVAKAGTEFHLTPEDNSYAYYCYACYGPMRDNTGADGKFSAECIDCGNTETRSSDDCGPLLRRSELIYFNDAAVKNSTWYHSSSSPDWAEAVAAGRITSLHAGSRHAAEDRSEGLLTDHDETWVYELRIKPEADISPRVYNDDPVNSRAWDETSIPGVTRYMNLFEDTGSISLLIDSRYVEIVGRSTITADHS